MPKGYRSDLARTARGNYDTNMEQGHRAATERKRRPVFEKAKVTRARNNALRRSNAGRLLLVLERCWRFYGSLPDPTSRRFAPFLNELRYACKLADEAGITHGSVRDDLGLFLLAFEFTCGDIVFGTFDTSVAVTSFPRSPAALDNDAVLAQAIEQTLMHAHPA